MRRGAAVGLAVALCCTVSASARWTAIASTASVDEASRGIVVFSGSVASIAPSAHLPAKATLRYNLVDIIDPSAGTPVLGARFRDNGRGARVVVTLKAYDLASETTSTLITLDSDDSEPSQDFVGREAYNNDTLPVWDPGKFYWVEAVLTKSTRTGAPALEWVFVNTAIL
jgi:hypothetical protein